MIIISEHQDQAIGSILLTEFKNKLESKLCDLALLPLKIEDCPNDDVVDLLVNHALALGLEYESDIAVISALTLANTPIDDDFEPEDFAAKLPFSWMEDILQEPDLDADDKMMVLLARWQSKTETDESLKPTMAVIDDLQETF